ncbi:DNA cytosine methyltransferase [Actinomycetota bacterium Odt1-20B]
MSHRSAAASHRTCLEICSGAGGQALGLERAGFSHQMLVDIDPDACQTLQLNRPNWNVMQADIKSAAVLPAIASTPPWLLAAGVPCPPFSLASQQLGADDERDLFPAALDLVSAIKPRAVLIENVKGLLQTKFSAYRAEILHTLSALGYEAEWRLLFACDFGVPQLRPRAVLVALEPRSFSNFAWPVRHCLNTKSALVGSVLRDSMASRGWELADAWAAKAQRIAPTLCGGSKKHGGPDLGPSRARRTWAEMGVNGSSVADLPPSPGDTLPVRLTVEQLALLQGFPPDWKFAGGKTSAYRQVGNAFPPPVAQAVGRAIAEALDQTDKEAGNGPHNGTKGTTATGMIRLPSPLTKPGTNAYAGTE